MDYQPVGLPPVRTTSWRTRLSLDKQGAMQDIELGGKPRSLDTPPIEHLLIEVL
jgi:hypothetical protein